MRPAVVADDFRALTVRVGKAFNGAGKRIVKTRPAAVRIEFVGRFIKFRAAAFADIDAFFSVQVIFVAKRRFRTFVQNDSFFFGSEGRVIWHIYSI